MKEIELHKWWLKPHPWEGPKAKPRLSRWLMSKEEAEKLGAIEPDLSTRKVIQVDDKPGFGGFAHLGTSWKKE